MTGGGRMREILGKANTIKARLTVYALLFSLPIILFSVISHFYSMQMMRRQIYETSMNVIYLYNAQIEMSLQNVDDYLSNLRQNEKSLRTLNQTKTEKDRLIALYEAEERLERDVILYKDIDAFFLFAPEHDMYTFASSCTEPYEQEQLIEQDIRQYIQKIEAKEEAYPEGWGIRKIGSGYYIIRIMKTGDLYAGAWVRTDHMLKNLDTLDLRGIDYILFADSRRLFTTEPEVTKKEIELPDSYDTYFISQGADGKYLIAGQDSRMGDFSLISVINEKNFSGTLMIFRVQIIAVILIDAVLMILFMGLVVGKIINPLKQLVETMKKIRKGSLGTRLTISRPTQEFLLVSEVFNSMIEEINRLKIEVYEKKLESQKVLLDFYTIQTNPHFFVNCMNVIYSFACIKDYEKIREFVKCIVAHFRYTLYNHHMALIRDELEFTRNYIEMQKIRSLNNYQFVFRANVDKDAENMMVPSLIIQEFVSNAVKHQKKRTSNMEIDVTVSLTEKEREKYLHIVIEDNGSGFDLNVMQSLEQGKEITDDRGKHIGIYNIQQRLTYLYGEKKKIHFSNREPSGAKVEIWIAAER